MSVALDMMLMLLQQRHADPSSDTSYREMQREDQGGDKPPGQGCMRLHSRQFEASCMTQKQIKALNPMTRQIPSHTSQAGSAACGYEDVKTQ
jgi:hypothetical protein